MVTAPACDSCGKELTRFSYQVEWADGSVSIVDDACRPQEGVGDVVGVAQVDNLAEAERMLETGS